MKLLCALLFVILVSACTRVPELPDMNGMFVDLATVEPTIQKDIRYYGEYNFIGRRINGYRAAKCMLVRKAAVALQQAQTLALRQGYSLKVYDCYRPQQAVDDFVAWALDINDTKMQSRFYPAVPKDKLFDLGYIAVQSGHSRGSTVDITLVPATSRASRVVTAHLPYDCRADKADRYPDNSLDMGTGYDCFDELSHTDNPAIVGVARQNRDKLREIMEAAGFVNYANEWWHYTLSDEPYPDTYFDNPIR